MYATEILRGKKKYEFRRSVFTRKTVDRVYIYASTPTKKLVGSFEVGKITNGSPYSIWKHFSKWSGMSAEAFFNYFAGTKSAYAIGIRDLRVFDSPIDPRQYVPLFCPPQSFCYFDESIMKESAESSS